MQRKKLIEITSCLNLQLNYIFLEHYICYNKDLKYNKCIVIHVYIFKYLLFDIHLSNNHLSKILVKILTQYKNICYS